MRAVRYLGPGRPFELRSVAIPSPGPGEVLVRVAACGMCRTELHLRDGLLDLGRRDFTIGHEIAGSIAACGPGAAPGRVGQNVVVYYYQGCGACRWCRQGEENLCPAPHAQPGFTADGGMAEYVCVPERNAVALPPGIAPVDAAPVGCAGSTAVHACALARLQPGERVVVHGAGGVGFALIQVARQAGAQVVAIGRGAERMALAAELGATLCIDAATLPAAEVARAAGEADVVFDCVGSTATLAAGIAMLARQGRLVLLGYTPQDLVTHPIGLIVKEACIIGSVGATLADLQRAVDMLAAGTLRLPIARTLPLDRFEDGLAAIEAGSVTGRIVLLP